MPATTLAAPEHRDLPELPEKAHPRWGTLLCAGLFVVALGLRLFHIVPAYNLFIDEITYAEIARNIAEGRGVTHHGEPFALHPPIVLGTFGLVIRVFGLDGDLAGLAFALRPVAAVFGAGTVVLAYLIGRRAGFGAGWALAAATLVALDPFQVRYDSQVMLEAQTQFFAALTILLVMALRPARTPPRLLVAAGLSAGVVFCSKETVGLVLGVALLVIAATDRLARRRDLGAIIGIGLGFYLTNLVLTIWLGGLDAWTAARGNGLTRLIGLNQETGFNSDSVRVSLFSRLVANFDRLAVTYALLLLGGVCCMLLVHRLALWRRTPPATGALPRELVAVVAWALAACGYLLYAMVLGSLEEQMYYIPLLPCALCLVAVIALSGTWVRTGWKPLIALFLAVDAVVWTKVHTTDSNIYRQFFTWSQTGLPPGSRVAVTEDSAQFVLSGMDLGNWHTAQALENNQVDYVLINPRLVEHGYGLGDPDFLKHLRSTGRPVFSASSEPDGTLILFDVRPSGEDR